MTIPLPSAMERATVTWTLGHADTTGPLAGARGRVRFEATAVAVAYSDRTVLPKPVETPIIAGVMTPVDLIVNDPDIWNWKVQVRVGAAWEPFHINVEPGGTNLASAAPTPGKGPVRVLKGDRGAQGASLTSLEQVADDTLRGEIHDPLTGETTARTYVLPRGPEGPYGGTAVTDPQVASYVIDESTDTASALNVAFVDTPRRVVHGHLADFPRPAGARPVEWFGTVEPDEMADGDTLWLFEPPYTGVDTFGSGSLTGWTTLWNSPDTWVITSDPSATGGQVAQNTGPPAGRKGLVLDAAGEMGDSEIVARIKRVGGSGAASAGGGLLLRASGSTATANNYIAATYLGKLHISRTVGGSFSDLATVDFSVASDEWHWIRFRAEGTTLSAKAWHDGDAEPSGWTVTAVDASLSTGRAGAFASDTQLQSWDVIGIAADGLTAPKGA